MVGLQVASLPKMVLLLFILFDLVTCISCQLNLATVFTSESPSAGVSTMVPAFDVMQNEMAKQFPVAFRNAAWINRTNATVPSCGDLNEESIMISFGQLASQNALQASGLTALFAPTCIEAFRFVGDIARGTYEYRTSKQRNSALDPFNLNSIRPLVFIFVFGDVVPYEYRVRWQLNDTLDEKVHQGLRSVLAISTPPVDWNNMKDFIETTQTRRLELFNVPIDPEAMRNEMLIGCHEAMESILMVYNESYSEFTENTKFSGKLFAKKFAKRTFNLKSRPVTMSPYSTREPDLVIEQFDQRKNEYHVVFYWNSSNGTLDERYPVIWMAGAVILDRTKCGFNNEKCSQSIRKLTVGVTVGIAVLLVIGTTALVIKLRYIQRQAYLLSSWKIPANTVLFVAASNYRACLSYHTLAWESTKRIVTVNTRSMWITNIWTEEEIFRDTPIKHTGSWFVHQDVLQLIQNLQKLTSSNINPFVGICVDAASPFILSEYCKRGSLEDLTAGAKNLDWDLKYCLLVDLVQGIEVIHGSSFGAHGGLTSTRCLIDQYFGLRVSDLGYSTLRQLAYQHTTTNSGEQIPVENDIRAFAVITSDLLWNKLPNLVDPIMDAGIHVDFRITALIDECYEQRAILTISAVKQKLQIILHSAGVPMYSSLFEKLSSRLNNHARVLEVAVATQTSQLLDEMERCDTLLGEMLPKEIINALRCGQSVAPMLFESASVFFSDIVGFLDFVTISPLLEVMEFLHKLYSDFDEVLAGFKVYKVESSGDSYMVASGVPVGQIGHLHIQEICLMALALQEKFRAKYWDGPMKLREGIHTGRVAAGVIGSKLPRYCLFGDTVNVASRMQSNGLPSMIHVSEEITILGTSLGFVFEFRSVMNIKGKGQRKTYWLKNSSRV